MSRLRWTRGKNRADVERKKTPMTSVHVHYRHHPGIEMAHHSGISATDVISEVTCPICLNFINVKGKVESEMSGEHEITELHNTEPVSQIEELSIIETMLVRGALTQAINDFETFAKNAKGSKYTQMYWTDRAEELKKIRAKFDDPISNRIFFAPF